MFLNSVIVKNPVLSYVILLLGVSTINSVSAFSPCYPSVNEVIGATTKGTQKNQRNSSIRPNAQLNLMSNRSRNLSKSAGILMLVQGQPAMLVQQLIDLPFRKPDRSVEIVINNVLFESAQIHLNRNGLRTIQKLADILQKNPHRKVLIEGYTDNTGSINDNQTLSERRADAVSTALQMLGIPDRRISVHSYGQSFPVQPNDSDQHRQMNRRVEILLSDDNGELDSH